jgi:hypothetical protein
VKPSLLTDAEVDMVAGGGGTNGPMMPNVPINPGPMMPIGPELPIPKPTHPPPRAGRDRPR